MSNMAAADEAARLLAKAAEHWSAKPVQPERTRWWESPLIVRHINRTYCSKTVEGTDGGDIELIRMLRAGRSFRRAVSVGGGNGFHEIRLLQSGLVDALDMFEISPTRAQQARERAIAAGVGKRLLVRVGDAFTQPPEPTYDLVYWKDALHHMFDVAAAVRWSRDVLTTKGLFFMNEFIGPTRMQYSDRQLDLAARARAALPTACLDNPRRPGVLLPVRPARPDLALMVEIDPSECADSSTIQSAVRQIFPGATLIPTGGIVYMLALNDVLANLHETEDEPLLRAMMLADDLCIEAGETLYAVGYATKH